MRLVEAAQGDWRGAVLLGITLGLRSGNVANLFWESIDMEAGLLRIDRLSSYRFILILQAGSERPRGIDNGPFHAALKGLQA